MGHLGPSPSSAPLTVTLSQLLGPSTPQFPSQCEEDSGGHCLIRTLGTDPEPPPCLNLSVPLKPQTRDPLEQMWTLVHGEGHSNFPKFIWGASDRTRLRNPPLTGHGPPPQSLTFGRGSVTRFLGIPTNPKASGGPRRDLSIGSPKKGEGLQGQTASEGARGHPQTPGPAALRDMQGAKSPKPVGGGAPRGEMHAE